MTSNATEYAAGAKPGVKARGVDSHHHRLVLTSSLTWPGIPPNALARRRATMRKEDHVSGHFGAWVALPADWTVALCDADLVAQARGREGSYGIGGAH